MKSGNMSQKNVNKNTFLCFADFFNVLLNRRHQESVSPSHVCEFIPLTVLGKTQLHTLERMKVKRHIIFQDYFGKNFDLANSLPNLREPQGS